MPDTVEFETPENVKVSYQIAGLGSRFIAWFIDSILLGLVFFLLLIALIMAGFGGEEMTREFAEHIDKTQPGQTVQFPLYLWGIAILISGLGSFLYFGLSEFMMRGQTFGKRSLSIRVVKVDGFAPDPASIFIRSIFRVIDNFPAAWLVPLLAKNSQRLGDLVAGTVVIKENLVPLSGLRERLLKRPESESKYAFSGAILSKANPEDTAAAEKTLERWAAGDLKPEMMDKHLETITGLLCERLGVDPPSAERNDRVLFLMDFLGAEYRRQHRQIG